MLFLFVCKRICVKKYLLCSILCAYGVYVQAVDGNIGKGAVALVVGVVADQLSSVAFRHQDGNRLMVGVGEWDCFKSDIVDKYKINGIELILSLTGTACGSCAAWGAMNNSVSQSAKWAAAFAGLHAVRCAYRVSYDTRIKSKGLSVKPSGGLMQLVQKIENMKYIPPTRK